MGASPNPPRRLYRAVVSLPPGAKTIDVRIGFGNRQAVSGVEQKLAKLLHATPKKLELLSKLGEDERRKLAADLERAQQSHSHHLRRAMAQALDHIPWPMRGLVRKLFS